MTKKALFAGVSVAVIFGAHTAYWVYESGKIKSSLAQLSGKISKDFGNKKVDFSFEDARVSGYPFAFNINFVTPQISVKEELSNIIIKSAEQPISVTSNLLGNKYQLNMPKTLSAEIETFGKKTSYKIDYNNLSPQFSLILSKNILLTTPESASVVLDAVKKFSYKDSGYTVTADADGAKIGSSASNSLEIVTNKSKKGSITTTYDGKTSQFYGAEIAKKADSQENAPVQALWPVDVSVSFSTTEELDAENKSKSVNFAVNNFDFKAASFGLGLSGNMTASGEDMFPYGDMTLKLSGYENLVDYLIEATKSTLSSMNVPFLNAQGEQLHNLKKVLADISTEKTNSDKDLIIKINREKGKSLFIGKKGLMEVLDIFKQYTGAADAEKKDEKVQPDSSQPPLAGSPAQQPANDNKAVEDKKSPSSVAPIVITPQKENKQNVR